MIRISEIYGAGGVTQGEGALLGVKMPFIRVASCNLSCSWCDSKYTWEQGYDYTAMTVAQILDQTLALCQGCRWVSLTGGEPTIYKECGDLAAALGAYGKSVIVETNGLMTPAWFDLPNVFVSCAPKLPGSGQDSPAHRQRVRRLVAARAAHSTQTQYKFVIAVKDDLLDLVPYCQAVGIAMTGDIADAPVYVQPDGWIAPIETYLAQLAWLQDAAPPWVRITPQVHRLIYGPAARSV